MTRESILKKLAPCGLDCSRCASFMGGEVSKHGKALLDALQGYKRLVDLMVSRFAPFAHYDAFERILAFFADAGCAGCRDGGGAFPGCAAKTCAREKRVDFCGECAEFPCGKNSFNESLHRRWIQYGEAIKNDGLEAFYAEQLRRPRY